MQSFRDLQVWRKSHELTIGVYRVSSSFPKSEMYGLASQVRRASSSIPANIAEGCGRGGNVEFARFLQIAMGSASELEYHLLLAFDLKLLEEEQYAPLADQIGEVKRMLTALIAKVRG